MITWPTLLPIPQQAYSTTASGRLIVSQFETGFRQRRRYTYAEDSIRVVWLFTQLEYDLFRAFVKHGLQNGALAFTTTILGLDGIEQAEVYIKDGAFAETYVPHAQHSVNAELVRANPTIMDENIYSILLLPELSAPNTFLLLSEVLFIYIENAYGDSASNAIVTDFLNSLTP